VDKEELRAFLTALVKYSGVLLANDFLLAAVAYLLERLKRGDVTPEQFAAALQGLHQTGKLS
jgi:hypothetical protein